MRGAIHTSWSRDGIETVEMALSEGTPPGTAVLWTLPSVLKLPVESGAETEDDAAFCPRCFASMALAWDLGLFSRGERAELRSAGTRIRIMWIIKDDDKIPYGPCVDMLLVCCMAGDGGRGHWGIPLDLRRGHSSHHQSGAQSRPL